MEKWSEMQGCMDLDLGLHLEDELTLTMFLLWNNLVPWEVQTS